MERTKRHVGRPKAAPQTGPLVLSERRTRTKIEVEIHTDAAEELGDYVRWVETSEGLSADEARAATVEFALRNVFKRDRLWHAQRRRGDKAKLEQADHAADSAGAHSPPPPPSGPRLPPPPGARAGSDRA